MVFVLPRVRGDMCCLLEVFEMHKCKPFWCFTSTGTGDGTAQNPAADLGIFFKEVQTAPQLTNAFPPPLVLSKDVTASPKSQPKKESATGEMSESNFSLEAQLQSLDEQLSSFENNLSEYDEMLKTLETATSCSESESEVNN